MDEKRVMSPVAGSRRTTTFGVAALLEVEDASGIAQEVATHDIGAAAIYDTVTKIRIGAMNGAGGSPVDGFLG